MIHLLLSALTAWSAAPVDLLPLGNQSGSYGYPYGGKTSGTLSKDASPVLAYRGDATEWSGWTIHLPRNLDLARIREKGGLELEIRGRWGREAVSLGLLDDDADGPGHRVQIRAKLGNYATVGTEWTKVVVPFGDFEDVGAWWDEKTRQEVPGKFDWSRLQEIRILSDRGAASAAPADSAGWIRVEVRNWRIVDSSSAWKPASQRGEPLDQPALRWNHLGYAASGPKRLVAANLPDSTFSVLEASSGKQVFRGTFAPSRLWEASGETARIGDFSALTKTGKYLVEVGTRRTRTFEIADRPFPGLLDQATKAFYLQRSGVELPEKFAGPFARPLAHPDTGLPLLEAGREGTWSTTGGWYDAGDYGKYVVNAAYSVGVLLQAWQAHPKAFSDATGIPESGNGVADLLDEVAWEMRWMESMQDTDGGVFFKVASLRWDGMVAPRHAQSGRHVIGKSTTSALGFSAAAAQAGRLTRSIDQKRARAWIEKAERAYAWARQHPAVREPKNTGGSGPYEDSDPSDEFLWAATELWLATGKDNFRLDATRALDTIPVLVTSAWQHLQNLAVYSLALDGSKDPLAAKARAKVDSIAAVIRAEVGSHPYHAPATGFMWGSNDPVLAKAVPLDLARRLHPDSDASGIVDMVDYVLGRNATGYSFVTGTGEGSSRDPHSRLMVSDKVDDPMPGFLVGGPNWGREDSKSKVAWGVDYPYQAPARAYLDKHESYASNEVAINWNAVLVAALAALATP